MLFWLVQKVLSSQVFQAECFNWMLKNNQTNKQKTLVYPKNPCATFFDVLQMPNYCFSSSVLDDKRFFNTVTSLKITLNKK